MEERFAWMPAEIFSGQETVMKLPKKEVPQTLL
jgi:hypothetical protein